LRSPPNSNKNKFEFEAFNQWFRITAMSKSRGTAIGNIDTSTLAADKMAELTVKTEEGFTARKLMDGLRQKPDALAFATRCANNLAGRRGVFFSRDGGHIGSGPPNVAENDHIYVLDGVEAPMILLLLQDTDWTRDGGGGDGVALRRYTVVGAAYVCGFGNLARFKAGDGEHDWKDIILT
jgi:hypothetical protein